ncbi:MAG TPA: glycosyl hydrolase [Thermodesulfobacteriota bacterium]|nr:glycosyl hydrolase [Thermodesulfobacteriota bacterium]
MRLKLSALFTSLMLLSSTLAFDAPAQEARRLGLNITLRTYEEELKDVNGLGVGAIRVPLQWQFIKIRPGEYDWSNVDRLVKAAQTRQFDVLFTVRTTFQEKPKKNLTGVHPQKGFIQLHPPSMDMKEWVHFVEILANRYQGQGANYEIESEVNDAASWKGTREEYLELLKAGYEGIKKADPKAKVLPSAMGCGITRNLQLGSGNRNDWRWHDSWLQAILSTKQFDAVSVHDYYFPSEIIANGLTFRDYLEHIRDVMEKSGLKSFPVWITETGFVSLPADAGGRIDDGSPERQAKWLKEAYQQAVALNVERVYWCLLRDSKKPYFGSMGLADAKGDPRPAWNALAQFGMGKEQK